MKKNMFALPENMFIVPEELIRRANEAKEISSIIKRLKNIQLILRMDVSLTPEQNEFLKKVPASQRALLKRKFLERARRKKERKIALMVKALEEKIRASNLPPRLKNSLLKVTDQVENTNQPSPEAVEKAEKIAASEGPDETKDNRDKNKFSSEKIVMAAGKSIGRSSRAALRNISRIMSQNRR